MVTVYVWFPGEPGKRQYAHMVAGHAALNTNHGYFSFWPRIGRMGANKGILAPEAADFTKSSLDADVAGMGWKPDETLPIDGLDEISILTAWENIRSANLPYRVVDCNCCTVTGYLLNRGFRGDKSNRKEPKNAKYLSALLEATSAPSLNQSAGIKTLTPSGLLFFANLVKDVIEGTGRTEDEAAYAVQRLRGEKGIRPVYPVLQLFISLFVRGD